MHNPDWRHALLGSALIIGSSATLACGPDFQLRSLDREVRDPVQHPRVPGL